jgi:hypothetical protein
VKECEGLAKKIVFAIDKENLTPLNVIVGMIMTMFNQGTTGFSLYGSKMKSFILNCDLFHDMQVI